MFLSLFLFYPIVKPKIIAQHQFGLQFDGWKNENWKKKQTK